MNPTKPITPAGKDMLAHVVQYVPADASSAITAARLAGIEAEARGQAVEWIREALDLSQEWAGIARALVIARVNLEERS